MLRLPVAQDKSTLNFWKHSSAKWPKMSFVVCLRVNLLEAQCDGNTKNNSPHLCLPSLQRRVAAEKLSKDNRADVVEVLQHLRATLESSASPEPTEVDKAPSVQKPIWHEYGLQVNDLAGARWIWRSRGQPRAQGH